MKMYKAVLGVNLKATFRKKYHQNLHKSHLNILPKTAYFTLNSVVKNCTTMLFYIQRRATGV